MKRFALSFDAALPALCLLLLTPLPSLSQDVIDYTIPRVDRQPLIDGDFSVEEWQGAERVPLTNETHPRQNVPALVETEVYLMEDGEYFHLAFVAHDPDPDSIRAFYRDRDASWEDDFVGVVLDTFNDERRAFEFFANPLGVQMDLIQDDIARREDSSWNAIWDSAGRIGDSGYVVEMRIPLRQLRFPEGLDEQTWGIDLLRFYPRDVRHRLSNNHWNFDLSCYLCQFRKASGFASLRSRANLQLIPTVTASLSESRPAPLTDPWRRDDANMDAGLDLRWGINADMILNATLNPDFSQVEADQAQLDINNPFTLFFPERREFFLDGAEYFNTQANQNLVHTRNIGEPNIGLKLTGKHGDDSYGLMLADDEGTAFLVPGNQGSRVARLPELQSRNLAARYRRDWGRNITLGLIGTARQGDAYSNRVVGVDGAWRVGSERLSVQALHSSSDYPLQVQRDFGQAAELEDRAYIADYRHDDRLWNWRVSYSDYGAGFRSDLGFINRVNYRQQLLGLGRDWWPDSDKALVNRFGISGDWDKTWDQDGLELEEEIEAGVDMEGIWQSYARVGRLLRQRHYNGRYFEETDTFLFAQVRPIGGMQISLDLFHGDSIDFANTRLGKALTVLPRFNMQFGKHLQLRLQHNYQRFDVAGGRLYTTNLSDLRLTWQFDANSFLRAILQYSDTLRDPALYNEPIARVDKRLSSQLLYSYRLNAQTRFFVGYSDAGFQDDLLDGLRKTQRSVFAKFSYAWQY